MDLLVALVMILVAAAVYCRQGYSLDHQTSLVAFSPAFKPWAASYFQAEKIIRSSFAVSRHFTVLFSVKL